MQSKVADYERIGFSDRLKSSLLAAGLSVRPTEFARAFNARANGSSVTVHAARKWLNGEAIPTQEKIVILSHWLQVHAAWLRFGDARNGSDATGGVTELALSPEHLDLIRDVMSLPVQAQQIVRDLVDSFKRHEPVSSRRHPGDGAARRKA